jgi:RNA polymerase sigma factor (TIGR02999 family)
LADLSAGRDGAREKLIPLVYEELHTLADRYIRRQKPGHTLQPTALVHEAYLRLGVDDEAEWENRAHFFRIAAKVMRNVLVDHARRRQSLKRGGGLKRVPLVSTVEITSDPTHSLIDLDAALERLAGMDPQTAQVVELRFFGGLNVEETGRVLGISPRTVNREWTLARAWLKKEIVQK